MVAIMSAMIEVMLLAAFTQLELTIHPSEFESVQPELKAPLSTFAPNPAAVFRTAGAVRVADLRRTPLEVTCPYLVLKPPPNESEMAELVRELALNWKPLTVTPVVGLSDTDASQGENLLVKYATAIWMVLPLILSFELPT